MKLRAFQKRVLARTHDYLKDNNLHIVAPPGAGKTILGAEIIKLVNQPTLILVPSLVLKKQWEQTLGLYFEGNQLSIRLDQVAEITISTYQDFYSKQLINQRKENWGLLVLDEAHHLKKAWAVELLKLKAKKEMKMLSLTATPPYDAPLSDWERYMELNGSIDEEISVTELIKEAILAPYQDYVYLVPVSGESNQKFVAYLAYHEKIASVLASNQEVTDYLLAQPFILEPLAFSEFIYNHLPLYLSCLSYLVDQDYQLTKEHWAVLGLTKQQNKVKIPSQSKKSLTELYVFLYQQAPSLDIFQYLAKHYWLDREGLRLFPTFKTNEKDANIPLKKEAIQHIVIKEELFLGKELCGVIFLDHIKEKSLINPDDALDLGVVPVFISLTELVQPETEVVAICGSFVVISEKLLTTEPSLLEFTDFSAPVVTAPNYRKIVITHKNRQVIVGKVTQLLSTKVINLLVGTVSLLGEGWDCPAINTVILGNVSGSFVQTQQLRGRGLRKAEGKELTNIWHIAPVYLGHVLDQQPELMPILKRLSYIAGLNSVDVEQPMISSDVNRFELPEIPNQQSLSSRINDNFTSAKERAYYKEKWQEALARGTHLSTPIFICQADPKPRLTRSSEEVIKGTRKDNFFQKLSLVFFADFRKKRRWQKYCQQTEKIIGCVYTFLKEEKIMTGDEKLEINWDQADFFCCLNTPKYHIEKIFNQTLRELLQEINQPRYLLQVGKIFYTVPKKYGSNLKEAVKFLKAIQVEFPKAMLFYTKNVEGRKKMMAAYFMENNRTILEQKIWR